MPKGSEGLFSNGPLLTKERFGAMPEDSVGLRGENPSLQEPEEVMNRSRKAAEQRTLPSHTTHTASRPAAFPTCSCDCPGSALLPWVID